MMRQDQFLRTRLLLGAERFKRLAEGTVTIVGLGAVGGAAAEALARAGVGHLRLVDFAVVKETNINRQPFALHSTVGLRKTEAAARRIRDINPACRVEPVAAFVAPDTVDTVLGPSPGIVIDAIDGVNAKALLLESCVRRGITVLSSMGAALRTDPQAVRTGDLFSSHGCPLANCMRKYLRRRGIGPGAIECVYSPEPPAPSVFDPDVVGEAESGGRGRRRKVLGSMVTVTGSFGLALAARAIALLSGPVTRGQRKKPGK